MFAHLFGGEEDVYGVADAGIWAVEEHVDAADLAVDEACGFEGFAGGVQVGAAEEDVDVLGVADGAGVDGGDPGGDGVAAGDRVQHACGFKGGGGAEEALADSFHGEHHPVEEGRIGHRTHNEEYNAPGA
jgi:hypothetical protein